MNKSDIIDTFARLHCYLEDGDFSGWEYDDLLASPFVSRLTAPSLYLKIAAVQVAKRCPINLRPLLGVPRLKSTKGFGFMVKGWLYHHLATGETRHLETVERALSWLMEHRSTGYSGSCWGNDFDFASRAGFFPKGLPTIVWTAHIQEAFDLAFQVLGEERFRQVVIDTADFIVHDLPRLEDDSGLCLAYAPGIRTPIHNANLLGAVALLRAWKYTGLKQHLDLAGRAINWSLARMNPDGSWFYGDEPRLHWIDNYHTAYNLDSLDKARDIAGEELVGLKTIEQTYRFFKDHLFTADFKPKFYCRRLYPLDIQAAAQAIESFARYSGHDPQAREYAWGVADWTIRHMMRKNGGFGYRRYRFGKNNLQPIHWGQATMLSALGHLLYYSP